MQSTQQSTVTAVRPLVIKGPHGKMLDFRRLEATHVANLSAKTGSVLVHVEMVPILLRDLATESRSIPLHELKAFCMQESVKRDIIQHFEEHVVDPDEVSKTGWACVAWEADLPYRTAHVRIVFGNPAVVSELNESMVALD